MPKKAYKPKPVDTSHIRVTKAMKRLIEELARNTHEVWAKQRVSEGWTFGPKRNDERKEHPDLVPYDRLRKSEKTYDRKTAAEVIKVLLAMGYKIEKG